MSAPLFLERQLPNGLARGPSQKPLDERGQSVIDDEEENRGKANRDQDDGRRGQGVLSGRPGHLLELGLNFPQKLFHTFKTRSDIELHDDPPSLREKLAGQEGFEPPTPGFGVRCSIR